jgi:hypothetical protein
MQADEPVLIRCFDSAREGAARFSAHTGFDDPTSPPDAPPRESLEVRILVFFPPQDIALTRQALQAWSPVSRGAGEEL